MTFFLTIMLSEQDLLKKHQKYTYSRRSIWHYIYWCASPGVCILSFLGLFFLYSSGDSAFSKNPIPVNKWLTYWLLTKGIAFLVSWVFLWPVQIFKYRNWIITRTYLNNFREY